MKEQASYIISCVHFYKKNKLNDRAGASRAQLSIAYWLDNAACSLS